MVDSTRRQQADESDKALHGPRSEVNWEGGSGRQPYGNQAGADAGAAGDAEPPGNAETEEGNRGDLSGRNIEQLEEARRKP